jgi:hypothetical protein
VVLAYHHGGRGGGADVSSKSVDWEPVILTYHHRELMIQADPWMKVIYNM